MPLIKTAFTATIATSCKLSIFQFNFTVQDWTRLVALQHHNATVIPLKTEHCLILLAKPVLDYYEISLKQKWTPKIKEKCDHAWNVSSSIKIHTPGCLQSSPECKQSCTCTALFTFLAKCRACTGVMSSCTGQSRWQKTRTPEKTARKCSRWRRHTSKYLCL